MRERRISRNSRIFARQLLELVADLVAAQCGQPLQAQIENGTCLILRQRHRPVLSHGMARIRH